MPTDVKPAKGNAKQAARSRRKKTTAETRAADTGGKANLNLKIVAGNSNRPLADAICDQLDIPITKCVVRRFADMEIFVEVHENVRGEDVYVVQPTSYPANYIWLVSAAPWQRKRILCEKQQLGVRTIYRFGPSCYEALAND